MVAGSTHSTALADLHFLEVLVHDFVVSKVSTPPKQRAEDKGQGHHDCEHHAEEDREEDYLTDGEVGNPLVVGPHLAVRGLHVVQIDRDKHGSASAVGAMEICLPLGRR